MLTTKSLKALALILFINLTQALFQEDAGNLDFLVVTSGHGPVRFVHVVEEYVITSDSSTEPWNPETDSISTSCYVACRNVSDGSLIWRRNVCSKIEEGEQRHATIASRSVVATLDAAGSLRTWDIAKGSLIWETWISGGTPVIWISQKDSIEYVVSGKHVFEATTGKPVNVGLDRPSWPRENKLQVFCPEAELTIDAHRRVGSLSVSSSQSGAPLRATHQVLTPDDHAHTLSLVSCSKTQVRVLLASTRGTTTVVAFKLDERDTHVSDVWSAEEGLATIVSAVMIDSSHFVDAANEERGEHLLSLSSRLKSHWSTLSSIMPPSTKTDRREHTFGFQKTAVLVSVRTGRVFGINTAGAERARIRYKLDLPRDAEWHRIVRGSLNGGRSSFHGSTHSREMLVLSSVAGPVQPEIHWSCFEGTSGSVLTNGSINLLSAVGQIVPFAVGRTCRQSALLLTKDGSVHVVPSDNETEELIKSQIASSRTHLYSHFVNRNEGELTSRLITLSGDKLVSHTVGSASFPGERILAISYASRDEVIQSPSSVLGDDSLLLKYLNPHIVVIMTAKVSSDDDTYSHILRKGDTNGQKRKPAGALQEEPTHSEDAPNLFVYVIDSVSGRIIYRASHMGAAFIPLPSAIISENWIFYTFVNEKTRRAEIGVLSLYEGMVDSKSLTAFSSLEQASSFSSFDARETKPVVLAKTFSLSKPTTALGMTISRGGISSRKLLLATIDGQIASIDRQVLEPRRPVGPLKETEKKEGLLQYSEFVTLVSYMSLNYNRTVESVKWIVTAPTDLESQSLVIAFGGPDIFFTRTSPSRGFDLLPHDFNRPLLLAIVVGLLVVLIIVKSRTISRIKLQSWGN